MITSGSWRSTARSPLANVKPALSLVWPWLTPGRAYSTGSSIVTMFLPVSTSSASDAYSVEVLPLPVGPVISTIPSGR